MPLQSTSGAASYDAFGGGVAAVPKYIEDYFSTFLYSGTGSDQTITNNIDLSTKGGLVWLKKRTYPSGSVTSHYLMDTNRGTSAGYISSNSTAAENAFDIVSSFNTNGFDFNTPVNDSGDTYVSWTWAKAPKFFDVVTYTGNGSFSQDISHALGSVPGCVIIKRTNSTSNWFVYHRGNEFAPGEGLALNLTASSSSTNRATLGVPTSTTFSAYFDTTNVNGATYVAYVFAHNAGGFGLTGTDNVISCGSFTANASGNVTVNIGYEPQWLMFKKTSAAQNWVILDNMRGWSYQGSAQLNPNVSDDESVPLYCTPDATGFTAINGGFDSNATYIYIAIRRGPMKVPTDATKVFAPVSRAGTYTVTPITAGFAPDLIVAQTSNLTYGAAWWDKLRGPLVQVRSYTTAAELSSSGSVLNYNNTGVTVGLDGNEWINGVASGNMYANWIFQRAPSFFDEVCYTGTNGNNQAFTHNLGAVPELMIIKMRVFSSGTGFWFVYSSTLGYANYLLLNSTAASASAGVFGSQNPDSSSFYVSGGANINSSASQYVAYLFATCAGVSKVGTYTGNGTTQTINCGFTGGARFVLIKRTDSTGDWYTYDTARGMTVLTDPYLLINSQTAQTATLGSVTTVSTGFALNSTILAAINVSAGTYIFLAIA